MATRGDIVHDVDAAPAGPRTGAFFDLDRTMVAGFSVFGLLFDAVLGGRIGPRQLGAATLAGLRFQLGQLPFADFVREAAGLLRGVTDEEMERAGEQLFEQRLAPVVYPEAMALVRAHRRAGHTLAIVSSATRYQTEPLARALGIPHVLCTRLEVEHGRLTGDLVPPPCYGEGKLTAARGLAGGHGVDLEETFFYTDSDEDLPLLEQVGRPRPTNPGRGLAQIAAERGWPARTFSSRGLPATMDVVRTVLSVGSLVPSVLLGVPVALLEGRWQPLANLTIATWGELGTALSGITLDVRGEHNLWAERPAVFIFNHQSAAEPLLLCKLLHHDFVAVAKQEVRRHPIFGPAFTIAGTVFIDRGNHVEALRALEPAVQALRDGLSLVVAPEGTRSSVGRLAPFKKGAFRMAMAAGVPIVPIVFLNSLDALPKHGIVARPARVEVVVHPPIPTRGWTAETLAGEIAAIERLYEETLAAW